ncbi:protein MIS12 homolog [Ornithodoros turicata]|uniref:protein MIS12 homolog n=1 Tax=Ornithodoros turicata TaxID=34597 RepID=UPI0031393CE4
MEKSSCDTTSGEYNVQMFEATPQAIADSLYNIYIDRLEEHLHLLKEVARKILKNDAEEKLEEKFATIIENNVNDTNKQFDRLEVYLSLNALSIPSHVLLPEDCVHRSPKEYSTLKAEIDQLKEGIMQEKCRREALLQELEQQKAIEPELLATAEYVQQLCGVLEP